MVVGEPVRRSDNLKAAEAEFVAAAAAWAAMSGVDRRTLSAVGVDRAVLNRAGIRPTLASDMVRLAYPTEPFTVGALVGRSGISESTVRKVLLEDEESTRIERIEGPGRMLSYRMT